MTIEEIIRNAEWITDKTKVIIKFAEFSDPSHIIAVGPWFCDRVLKYVIYKPVKMEMDFKAGRVVFYIA